MLAPSASEPTMVPLVLGVARTFSGVPLVFTVPAALAEATDIVEMPASRTPVNGTRTASLDRRGIRGTRTPRGRGGSWEIHPVRDTCTIGGQRPLYDVVSRCFPVARRSPAR